MTFLDVPALVSRLKIPLLIVHGDRDEIIPVDEVYSAHEPNSEKTEMTIISGADHMFSNKNHRESVSRQIVKWFDNKF